MKLGVLQLQARPMTDPGTMNSPATFPFPILCRQVPFATTPNVVHGLETERVQAAYVETAKALVAEGCTAITTNCGFTVRFQAALAQALPVPVSTSSLLLLPHLLATTRGRVGVLTFDSRPLTLGLLASVGIQTQGRVVIDGLDDSTSWATLGQPSFDLDMAQFTHDVMVAIDRLRATAPDISALLLECTAFPLVANQVRTRTGLPVYDAVTNARLLMAGAAGVSAL